MLIVFVSSLVCLLNYFCDEYRVVFLQANRPVDLSIMSTEKLSSESTINAAAVGFDDRFLTEFNGSGNVVDWWLRAEILCKARGVEMMKVLPSKLTKDAFSVWAQLDDAGRRSEATTREALYEAFGIDEVSAFEQFRNRRLRPGESPDVFLSQLKALAASFGGMPERAIKNAFITGLPADVASIVQMNTTGNVSMSEVLAKARQTLLRKANCQPDSQCFAASRSEMSSSARAKCFLCDQPGHFARQCPQRPRKCFKCSQFGHLARDCPGNEQRGGDIAPAPSRQ